MTIVPAVAFLWPDGVITTGSQREQIVYFYAGEYVYRQIKTNKDMWYYVNKN